MGVGPEEEGAIWRWEPKSCPYDRVGHLPAEAGSGRWGRGVGTSQVQFTPVEQFPLDLFTRFQADGGRQRQGKAHVEPGVLSARTNRLSIEVSQQGRRAGRKKERKRVLRQMKKLVGTVRGHARRHRQLLDEHWQQTEWTRAQAEQILRRLDGVLELLPRAQKQAHERIIGARPVANAEKILSLYDPDVRVIVRGKAGAEVEFGNTVLLGENRQGVIVDYQIFRESAPADSQTLFGSLLRVWDGTGQKVQAVVTDRGFCSASNSRTLQEAGTYDATCPRQPEVLRQRLREERFARLQRRRAQTEARIGILKREFLGRPLRAKGFIHRELALAWGVLTHNLWMLARMRKPRKKSVLRPAAA